MAEETDSTGSSDSTGGSAGSGSSAGVSSEMLFEAMLTTVTGVKDSGLDTALVAASTGKAGWVLGTMGGDDRNAWSPNYVYGYYGYESNKRYFEVIFNPTPVTQFETAMAALDTNIGKIRDDTMPGLSAKQSVAAAWLFRMFALSADAGQLEMAAYHKTLSADESSFKGATAEGLLAQLDAHQKTLLSIHRQITDHGDVATSLGEVATAVMTFSSAINNLWIEYKPKITAALNTARAAALTGITTHMDAADKAWRDKGNNGMSQEETVRVLKLYSEGDLTSPTTFDVINKKITVAIQAVLTTAATEVFTAQQTLDSSLTSTSRAFGGMQNPVVQPDEVVTPPGGGSTPVVTPPPGGSDTPVVTPPPDGDGIPFVPTTATKPVAPPGGDGTPVVPPLGGGDGAVVPRPGGGDTPVVTGIVPTGGGSLPTGGGGIIPTGGGGSAGARANGVVGSGSGLPGSNGGDFTGDGTSIFGNDPTGAGSGAVGGSSSGGAIGGGGGFGGIQTGRGGSSPTHSVRGDGSGDEDGSGVWGTDLPEINSVIGAQSGTGVGPVEGISGAGFGGGASVGAGAGIDTGAWVPGSSDDGSGGAAFGGSGAGAGAGAGAGGGSDAWNPDSSGFPGGGGDAWGGAGAAVGGESGFAAGGGAGSGSGSSGGGIGGSSSGTQGGSSVPLDVSGGGAGGAKLPGDETLAFGSSGGTPGNESSADPFGASGSQTLASTGGGTGGGGMGGGGMGGMPMMPGGQQGKDRDRERNTWLAEDSDIWGTANATGNGVIGLTEENEVLQPAHVPAGVAAGRAPTTSPRQPATEGTKQGESATTEQGGN